MNKGLFITVEGCDGAGKSTQAKLLVNRLRTEYPDREIVSTREPSGNGTLGETLREVVLVEDMTPITETLLFQAARAEHVHNLILPALERGAIVICDRYIHSTLAMQGFAMGVPLRMIEDIHYWSTNNLMPDITLFVDVNPVTALERTVVKNKAEKRGEDYANNVYNGFMKALQHATTPYIIIEGTNSIESVSEVIWKEISN